MSENILIAIGGTGARLVESLIPLLAAGLGPPNLTVGFIDQDESNGNVARARTRLQHYSQFRAEWSHGDASRLDWNETGLAWTRAEPLIPDGELWCPHPDRDTTLARIFDRAQLSGPERGLLDILYHADAREQDLKLGEGYRGLPHVGSAALVTEVEAGSPFWDRLLERLRNGRVGSDVRVFLAGSVFGGTGAAGYPTLARLLRTVQKTERLGDIAIGGCLMLPYFTFSAPKADEVAARPEDLLVQAQGALSYYDKLFQREKIFNEIFLVGWNPPFELGYGSPGRETQCNPPLPPDLIGALSILRFFEPGRTFEAPENRAVICSRKQVGALDWADLPAVADDAGANRARLGQLLRFCAAWRNTIRPALRQRSPFGGWPKWARNQRADKVTYAHEGQKRALAVLDQLVEDTLNWASAVSAYATRGGLSRFGLWDTSLLAQTDFDHPQDPVRLNPPSADDSRAELIYSALIRDAEAAARTRSQGQLIDELSERDATASHHQLGKLVAAVFDAARLYADRQPERVES